MVQRKLRTCSVTKCVREQREFYCRNIFTCQTEGWDVRQTFKVVKLNSLSDFDVHKTNHKSKQIT